MESSKNTVFPAEISDPVGFCNAHASRDLLHQAMCKEARTSAGCFQPAVIDLLAHRGREAARVDEFVLEELLSRGSIADEKCRPLRGLFKNPPLKNPERYVDKFLAAVRDVVLENCLKDRERSCESSQDSIIPLARHMTCESEAQNGTKDFDAHLDDGIKRHVLTSKCPLREFPALQVRKEPFHSKDPQKLSEQLMELLSQGHQLKVGVKGPHALVLSNYRVTCEKGAWTLQFQTLDSLAGTRWSAAKTAGDWVNGRALIENLEGHGVTWLDSAKKKLPAREFTIAYDSQTQKSPIVTDVAIGSAAYRAGLREGMEYLHHEFDENTNEWKVLVKGNDQKQLELRYQP